jgi:hypothetical protein
MIAFDTAFRNVRSGSHQLKGLFGIEKAEWAIPLGLTLRKRVSYPAASLFLYLFGTFCVCSILDTLLVKAG